MSKRFCLRHFFNVIMTERLKITKRLLAHRNYTGRIKLLSLLLPSF